MAINFVQQTFVDNSSTVPVSAANLNAVEGAVKTLSDYYDTLITTPATLTPSSITPGSMTDSYLCQYGNKVVLRFSLGISSTTITSGDTLFTFSGLPAGIARTYRTTITVVTATVLTTASIDVVVAADGTGGILIAPNGDRAVSTGTITSAVGLYGDVTFMRI